jgi:hypothetical protein
MKRLDLTGQRFGRLMVLEAAPPRRDRTRSRLYWCCQCDCGVLREVEGNNLRRGLTRSCGCFNREECATRATKHGYSRRGKRSPEFSVYTNAKTRCTNPRHIFYKNYGGRGIEFRFSSFQEFIEEVGPRPGPELTLDRIDNDGHYERGNVRWATWTEQAGNRRFKPHLQSTVPSES